MSWKQRKDIMKQVLKRSIIFTLQHKELVVPAQLGSTDPSYSGTPLIPLSLCQVLNPEKELNNIYCVPTYVRNVKSPGNSHGSSFRPFCNLCVECVRDAEGRSTALCPSRPQFCARLRRYLLNPGSKCLPSLPAPAHIF